MSDPPINLDAAYTILVQTCGVRDDAEVFVLTERSTFIQSIERQLQTPGPVEYRFEGILGFGGKFRIAHGRVYVDCYPEDETDERRGRIAVANQMLADLTIRPDPEPSP